MGHDQWLWSSSRLLQPFGLVEEERARWKDYMKAYEACLSATSTEICPWYIVPADDKENARLLISQIVLDTLAGLKMEYPKPAKKRRKELQAIRERLTR